MLQDEDVQNSSAQIPEVISRLHSFLEYCLLSANGSKEGDLVELTHHDDFPEALPWQPLQPQTVAPPDSKVALIPLYTMRLENGKGRMIATSAFELKNHHTIANASKVL